jgi:hypothetical protein
LFSLTVRDEKPRLSTAYILLVERASPLYEKKVRRVRASRAVWLPRPRLQCFFGVVATIGVLSPSWRNAQAQENAPSEASRTTWAVEVARDSRCAEDPEFAAELWSQVPEAQRAAASEAELVAEVSVQRAGKALKGTIHVHDRLMGSEAGHRELDLPLESCPSTAEALGLVLSVLVEAGRGAPPPAPTVEEPETPPEPPPAPPPPPEHAPRPRSTAPKRYAWQGPRAGHDLVVGGGIGYGLLPGAYPGFTIGWGLRFHDAWPVWSQVSWYPERSTDDHHATFSALYGGVFPCPLHVETERLRARFCPGFSAGVLWAQGHGFVEAKSGNQVTALLGIDLAGDVRILGPWIVSLAIRPEVPLLRERFVYYRTDGGAPELHQASALTLSAFLGTGLRFR